MIYLFSMVKLACGDLYDCMAIGAALGNIPISMCIGVGGGICIGGIIDNLNRNNRKDNQNDNNKENE